MSLLDHIRASAVLDESRLQSALQRQQIYGGSFDTVLLEQQLVDPPTLDRLLSEATGLPSVSVVLLDSVDDRPWEHVPSELVDLGWVMPVGLGSGPDGPTVQVAVHPEIPEANLQTLRAAVPNAEVMVTAECCLARLAAERTSSVIPQRYAVLALTYSQALRRQAVAEVRARQAGAAKPVAAPWMTARAAQSPESAQSSPQAGAPLRMPTQDPSAFKARTAAPAETTREGPVFRPPPRGDESAAPARPVRTGGTQIMVSASHEPAPHPTTPPVSSILGGLDDADLSDTGVPAAGSLVSAPIEHRAADLTQAGPLASSTSLSALDPRELEVTLETPAIHLPSPAGHDLESTHEGPAMGRDEVDVTDETPVFRGHSTTRPPISEPSPPASPPPSLTARIAGPLSEVRDARQRDAVTEALVRGATIVSPRCVLFGIKREGLRILSAGPALLGDGDPSASTIGTTVPRSDRLGRALSGSEPLERAVDLDLRLAVDLEDAVPCVLIPVEVVGRPVLTLYVDKHGSEIDAEERQQLELLCAAAGTSLEEVLKRRRQSQPDAPSKPEPKPQPPPEPVHVSAAAHDAGVPTAQVGPQLSWPPSQAPSHNPQPPTSRVENPVPLTNRLHAPPVRLRAPTADMPPEEIPREDESRDPTPPSSPPTSEPPRFGSSVPQLPKLVDPPARRSTTLIGQRPNRARRDPPSRDDSPLAPTTLTSVGPATHIPPPSNSRIPTLKPSTAPPPGVADPDITEEHPKFEPPTGTSADAGAKIVPLSTPLVQTSSRGKIQLDDEDRVRETMGPADSMEERIDGALDSVMAGRTGVRPLLDIGEPALLRVAAHFPGELDVFRRDLDALPPLSAHGPLIRVVVSMGTVVTPHIIELMDHPNSNVRFYAAFVFQELRDDRCIPSLGELAFDPDGDVRTIAMRVLETYHRSTSFERGLEAIRRELQSPNRTRQLHAVRALGTLRDIAGVPDMVELLASRDRFIQESALEALCSVTGQQLGLKPHRWRAWYQDNCHLHRVQWIISSLHHKDIAVRRWAADELRRITNQPFVFPAAGTKSERDAAIRQWENWWVTEGQPRFANP